MVPPITSPLFSMPRACSKMEHSPNPDFRLTLPEPNRTGTHSLLCPDGYAIVHHKRELKI